MTIPFVDLKAQYQSIKGEIDAAIQDVLNDAAFIGGARVKNFESAFAELHGVKYCIATSSGTDSLHLALWGCGIGPGDEVILPTNTFIATAEPVSLTGTKPVLVDNDEHFYNIDVEKIEGAITPRTKAILPVHLYGQPADMAAIAQIAARHNLLVIEDACQAHLAEYKGKRVGGFGVAAAFSFYPGKNLGAYGEGGAVVTNDEELHHKMLLIHDHGSVKRYEHLIPGHNYRLEGLQAAILNVKLKYIEDWTERRRFNARYYNQCLQDIDEVITPEEMNGVKHVYHLYVIRAQDRDRLRDFLQDRGVATGLHYPKPIHLMKAYEHLGYKRDAFPVAERYASEVLSLPIFPELTKEQIEYVAESIRSFYRK